MADRLTFEVLAHCPGQPHRQLLMPQPGCRGHQQLPVHHLVAITVLGQGSHHVGSVVNGGDHAQDRKSTRLNSSHLVISYAVFCLKKKKKTTIDLSISTT